MNAADVFAFLNSFLTSLLTSFLTPFLDSALLGLFDESLLRADRAHPRFIPSGSRRRQRRVVRHESDLHESTNHPRPAALTYNQATDDAWEGKTV